MPRWPSTYKRRGVTPLVPVRIDKEVRNHFKLQGSEDGHGLSTHLKHRLRELHQIDLLLAAVRLDGKLLDLIKGFVQEYKNTLRI